MMTEVDRISVLEFRFRELAKSHKTLIAEFEAFRTAANKAIDENVDKLLELKYDVADFSETYRMHRHAASIASINFTGPVPGPNEETT